MHALVLDNNGLTLRQREIRRPKRKEARLRILFAGLCKTDLNVADGSLPVNKPLILGHEFSARVIEVGALCQRVRAGDLVTCDPRLPSGFLGVEIDGAFAQELVIEENNLYCLSQETSPLHAAFLEPIAACLAPRKHLREDMQKGIIVGAGRIAYLTTRLLHLSGFSSFRQCDTLENIESSSQKVVIATSFNEQMCHDFTRVLERGGLLILKCRPTTKLLLDARLITLKELSIKGAAYADFNEATAFLMKNELKLDDLVGPIFPLNEYKRAFKEARKNISRKVFLQCAE